MVRFFSALLRGGGFLRRTPSPSVRPDLSHERVPTLTDRTPLQFELPRGETRSFKVGSQGYFVERRGGFVRVFMELQQREGYNDSNQVSFHESKKKEQTLRNLRIHWKNPVLTVSLRPAEETAAGSRPALPAQEQRPPIEEVAVPPEPLRALPGPSGEPVNPGRYSEERDVQQFRKDDLVPSRAHRLNDPGSFVVRTPRGDVFEAGLLVLDDAYMLEIRPVIRVATSIAHRSGDPINKALEVYDILCATFPIEGSGRGRSHRQVEKRRVVTLQLALQAAGVTSRYVLGKLRGDGYVWIEVAGEDGSFTYMFDPNMGIHGGIIPTGGEKHGGFRFEVAGWEGTLHYERTQEGATVWRLGDRSRSPRTLLGLGPGQTAAA